MTGIIICIIIRKINNLVACMLARTCYNYDRYEFVLIEVGYEVNCDYYRNANIDHLSPALKN